MEGSGGVGSDGLDQGEVGLGGLEGWVGEAGGLQIQPAVEGLGGGEQVGGGRAGVDEVEGQWLADQRGFTHPANGTSTH